MPLSNCLAWDLAWETILKAGLASSVLYLLAESVKDVLLSHHFKPVAVHFLPQMGVLALLQLNQGGHLHLKRLVAQVHQLLTKAYQELLHFGLDKIGSGTF